MLHTSNIVLTPSAKFYTYGGASYSNVIKNANAVYNGIPVLYQLKYGPEIDGAIHVACTYNR